MVKVILEKYKCIGCGTCAALCPAFWEIDMSKAILKGGKKIQTPEGEVEELEKDLDQKDLDCNKQCEDNCPVAAIKVK